jgi:hypothetical protein
MYKVITRQSITGRKDVFFVDLATGAVIGSLTFMSSMTDADRDKFAGDMAKLVDDSAMSI